MKQLYSSHSKERSNCDIKNLFILILLLVIVYFINTHIVRLAIVSGTSMYPTFMDKDILVINQMNYTPSGGDVVLIDVSRKPIHGKYIVKRIIAIEGDTVTLDYEKNSVYVNGLRVTEPYLNFDQGDPMIAFDAIGTITYQVPAGTVFILGDNRNNSIDSRSNMLGMIKKSDIIGKVFLRLSLQQYFS